MEFFSQHQFNAVPWKNPVFGGMVFCIKNPLFVPWGFSDLRTLRRRTSAVSFEMAKALASAAAWLNLAWDGMVCLSSIFLAWLVPGILNIPLSKMVGNQVGWPPNHYMENGSFTKHNPFKKSGCLGYQVVITSILVRYDHWSKISEVWHPDLASISQVVKWPLYMSHGKKTLTFHWILVV